MYNFGGNMYKSRAVGMRSNFFSTVGYKGFFLPPIELNLTLLFTSLFIIISFMLKIQLSLFICYFLEILEKLIFLPEF